VSEYAVCYVGHIFRNPFSKWSCVLHLKKTSSQYNAIKRVTVLVGY